METNKDYKTMWTDLDGFKTDFLERESGDGDSGAEYKDPSTPSPLMPRRSPAQDYKEVKTALTNITREVQGAEKQKETKKSKIPIRKHKYNSAEYDINDKMSEILLETDYLKWLALPVSEVKENNDNCNQKCPEIEPEGVELLDLSLIQNNLLELDYRDIYDDLSRVPEVLDQTSEETSLSPRAPLAEQELILEAPEQFREDSEQVDIKYNTNILTNELSNVYDVYKPDVRCGITETEHERDKIRGKEIEFVDNCGANQDITTIGGGGIDNYHKTCGHNTVVNGACVKEVDSEALALNILRARAAMRSIAQSTPLKIVENLEHLTKYCDKNSESSAQKCDKIIKQQTITTDSDVNTTVNKPYTTENLDYNKYSEQTNSFTQTTQEYCVKTVKEQSLTPEWDVIKPKERSSIENLNFYKHSDENSDYISQTKQEYGLKPVKEQSLTPKLDVNKPKEQSSIENLDFSKYSDQNSESIAQTKQEYCVKTLAEQSTERDVNKPNERSSTENLDFSTHSDKNNDFIDLDLSVTSLKDQFTPAQDVNKLGSVQNIKVVDILEDITKYSAQNSDYSAQSNQNFVKIQNEQLVTSESDVNKYKWSQKFTKYGNQNSVNTQSNLGVPNEQISKVNSNEESLKFKNLENLNDKNDFKEKTLLSLPGANVNKAKGENVLTEKLKSDKIVKRVQFLEPLYKVQVNTFESEENENILEDLDTESTAGESEESILATDFSINKHEINFSEDFQNIQTSTPSTNESTKGNDSSLKIVEKLQHFTQNKDFSVFQNSDLSMRNLLKTNVNSALESDLSTVKSGDVTECGQKCLKDESLSETHLQLFTNIQTIDYELDDVKDRSLQIISDCAVMKEMTEPKLPKTNLKLDPKQNLEVIADLPCLLKPLVPLKSNQNDRDVVDFSKSLLFNSVQQKGLRKRESVSDVFAKYAKKTTDNLKPEVRESTDNVPNAKLSKKTTESHSLEFDNVSKESVTDNVSGVSDTKYGGHNLKLDNVDFKESLHKVSSVVSNEKHAKNTTESHSFNVDSKGRLIDKIDLSSAKFDGHKVDNVDFKESVDNISSAVTKGSDTIVSDICASNANIPSCETACERSAVAAAAAAVLASIHSADAQATRRSRLSTAKVRTTSCQGEIDTTGDHSDIVCEHEDTDKLNGLKKTLNNTENNTESDTIASETIELKPTLLETIVKCSERVESEINNTLLRSRDINKRSVEGNSRLKLLEEKLREAAGLTDKKQNTETKPVLDKNDNECKQITVENSEEDEEDFYPQVEITELGSPADLDAFLDDRFGGRCEFDVRRIGTFSGYGGNEFFVVYDELEDESEDEARIKPKMRGEGNQEGPKRHNPDHDNLKSLLKKPGRKESKKNRVSFNETKNEFFDADYIILIREDCDYDEDEDDGVCTCNQHEMVRLTCCEPDCNCNAYEDQTPQSPKFAPPLEFVDSVTLSPPEGYKDMDQQLLALQQMARQRGAVCRECSGHHDSDSASGSEGESEPQGEYTSVADRGERREAGEPPPGPEQPPPEQEEKEKTDQSQQTTPTTPPADCTPIQQRYIMETITMTTVTERRMVREVEDTVAQRTGGSPPDSPSPCPSPALPTGSPISGILKGGKLWKQQSSTDIGVPKGVDNAQLSDGGITSDEEGNTLNRRIVRFSENDQENKRDSCDGEADKGTIEEEDKKPEDHEDNQKETDGCNNSISPEAQEMMLTFKVGNHLLISNNSLRPNSAVRQLFPAKNLDKEELQHQYLVTAESLKAFEEAKRSKLPQLLQGDDESLRRTIERNTLRRSLIRYEPRSKKNVQKTDNSLVERIKQLTCDVDEPPPEEEIPPRSSPTGEESVKPSEIPTLNNRLSQDKSFSPSSSSTTSSNSSMSSTYKKITDLFGKRDKVSDLQNNAINESKQSLLQTAPDLGNGGEFIESQNVAKINPSEARKQFLSTLAPLTACVSGTGAVDEFQYQYQLANPGERISVASTTGTEYSLEDIDEVLKSDVEESKKIAPDVLAGTPSASESADELAMFVQQDAGRIERIKKRYQPENTAEEDDEHDDYGFNRRPSVRGIKPRFGSTSEILQQIQSQLQPPAQQSQSPQQPAQPPTQPRQQWPYYSETGIDAKRTGYGYYGPMGPPDVQRFRPTSLIEEGIYQNCGNARCSQMHYSGTVMHPPVMRIGGGCSEIYSTLPQRQRGGRPESPPPMDMSRSYHQTMVLIPYNRIEGFQPGNVSPSPIYSSPEQCNYARFTTKKFPPNQPNKRYPEGYHGTLPPRLPGHPTHMDEQQYQQMKLTQKQMIRVPYSAGQPVQVHLMTSRSESPLPGQFATARATQTPSATLSNCGYYPGPPNTRYRPAIGPANVPHNGTTIWHDGMYTGKINRHSFPAAGPRYAMGDNISLANSETQQPIPNGYRQTTIDTQYTQRETSAPSSPTKNRFTSERGVPEGAASVSPQDSTNTSTSTMTSPTSPQNPPVGNGKSLYYAMNV